jgi:hypothetical protein
MAALCPQKRALADGAIQDLVTLHYAEAEAVTKAREKNDKIKLAFLLHTRKHSC